MTTPSLTQSSGSQYTRILGIGAARGDLVVPNDDLVGPINSSDEWIRQRTGIVERRRASADVQAVDALALATEAGSPKAVNVVLIGVLSRLMDIPEDAWLKAIDETVPPKFLELNRKAFELGRNA